MKIVRSASSHAAADRSNEARETLRFGVIQAKEGIPPDDDGSSPNPARGELNSASLNKHRRLIFQRCQSLISTGKQRTFAPAETVGVKRVGANQQNHHDTWETRSGSLAQAGQLAMGIHNHRQRSGRESDGLIVAMKRGNTRRAKEPCCMHAYINEE
jgi:hypothetical protein